MTRDTERRRTRPDDLHEWLSFEDPEEDRTWVFDVTFLVSNWTCIYGNGCKGVLTEATPELEQGCCSYGAHFVDEDDRLRVEAIAATLTPEQWQYHAEAAAAGSATTHNDDGDGVTRLVDDACIFLNRPGFPAGAGCALHQAAVAAGDSYLDWKPEVCWQLPLRRHDEVDGEGHVTSTVREWKRRDWGAGGSDFHWWCTEGPEAFVGSERVYQSLREELIAMVGKIPYAILCDLLEERMARSRTSDAAVFLPHPAVRRHSAS